MKEKIAFISILANMLLAFAKISIGFLSKSAAILADGFHSFMDILSSSISYFGIKISQKPVDKKHPYGHYKFEVLAGALITIILLATGIGIIFESVRSFFSPEEIKINYLVLGVMIFSIIISEIMARLKVFYGKKENSLSLLSDGIHSRVDVFTSLAVLLGLFLTRYWTGADSLLAFLIGFYIIKESFVIGKEAADSLLDVSAGPEIEGKIKSIAETENIIIDDLKTQKKGSVVTADLSIKLASNLSVEEASNISNNLRNKLIESIEKLSYVSVEIKSHDVTTGFYKPEFGKSFGWQRKGKFVEKIENAKGSGPGGYCVCPNCDYKEIHEKGTPCFSFLCPKCKINLKRENA